MDVRNLCVCISCVFLCVKRGVAGRCGGEHRAAETCSSVGSFRLRLLSHTRT